MTTLLKPNKDFATHTHIPVESPVEGYTAYIIEARSPRNPLWCDYTPALVINGRTITGKTYNLPGAAQAEIDDFFASLIEEQQQIQVEVDEAAIEQFVAEVAAAQGEPTASEYIAAIAQAHLDAEHAPYPEHQDDDWWAAHSRHTVAQYADCYYCVHQADYLNLPMPTALAIPPYIHYSADLGGFTFGDCARAYNSYIDADIARAEWLATV